VKIRFRCQNCQRVLVADDQYAGAAFHCPGCRQPVVVPRAEELARARPAKAEEGEVAAVKFQAKGGTDDEIDMTPMIDCVFLLLIFFLVTATFALQKSHAVPPPEQHEAASKKTKTIEQLEADDDYVIVKIEKDNTVFVNGVEAPSKQELLVKLRDARNRPGSSGRKPSSLLVLADGEARHETVIMAIDAGNGAGMENVRLATVSDEDF
jgi:biopolymer transport protein ExbD